MRVEEVKEGRVRTASRPDTRSSSSISRLARKSRQKHHVVQGGRQRTLIRSVSRHKATHQAIHFVGAPKSSLYARPSIRPSAGMPNRRRCGSESRAKPPKQLSHRAKSQRHLLGRLPVLSQVPSEKSFNQTLYSIRVGRCCREKQRTDPIDHCHASFNGRAHGNKL
jgi:hypothetical protein